MIAMIIIVEEGKINEEKRKKGLSTAKKEDNAFLGFGG